MGESGASLIKNETNNVMSIVEHYNTIAEKGWNKSKRSTNDCIYARKINNWIKAVQISEHVTFGNAVVDMCCGKGGDLTKYSKRQIAVYTGFDISDSSIVEASNRFNRLRPKFKGDFLVRDCFTERIVSKCHVVSCQFAIHYAFETENKIRTFLKNVTESLIVDGIFFGTCPDSDRIKELMNGSNECGNKYYSIKMKTDNCYTFQLNDAIDCLDEWLVPFGTLSRIALEYNLELIYNTNFLKFKGRYLNKYKDLYKIMCNNKDSPEALEVVSLYTAFAFKKLTTNN